MIALRARIVTATEIRTVIVFAVTATGTVIDGRTGASASELKRVSAIVATLTTMAIMIGGAIVVLTTELTATEHTGTDLTTMAATATAACTATVTHGTGTKPDKSATV